MENYDSTGQGTRCNIIRYLPFACRTTEATNTHVEYVILIAISLQRWMHEGDSMFVVGKLPVFIPTSTPDTPDTPDTPK